MKSTLSLVENITDNLLNEDWSAAVSDISLIDKPSKLLNRVLDAFEYEAADDKWYPKSEKDERWVKSIIPFIFGEYVVGIF